MAIAISGTRTGSGRRLPAAWLALALSTAACGGGSGDGLAVGVITEDPKLAFLVIGP